MVQSGKMVVCYTLEEIYIARGVACLVFRQYEHGNMHKSYTFKFCSCPCYVLKLILRAGTHIPSTRQLLPASLGVAGLTK